MKVKALIKLLKTFPQEEEIGFCEHDMNIGWSSCIAGVYEVFDEDVKDDIVIDKPMHYIVIHS